MQETMEHMGSVAQRVQLDEGDIVVRSNVLRKVMALQPGVASNPNPHPSPNPSPNPSPSPSPSPSPNPSPSPSPSPSPNPSRSPSPNPNQVMVLQPGDSVPQGDGTEMHVPRGSCQLDVHFTFDQRSYPCP